MLSAALASMSDFAHIYDRQGRFLFVNQALLDLWAIPLEAAVGRNFSELGYPATLAERLQRELQEVIETGQSITGETPYTNPTGHTGYYEYIFSPGFGANGGVDFVVGFTRDITERKLAEARLQESEARFSSAFEDAPIGIALVSPSGQWLKANRALCELFGYTEAELQTRTFSDLTHPEDIELSLDNVRRAIAGQRCSLQIEKRYIHKGGRTITALLNISLIRDSQGQPAYFISQIQDITERKLAEAAIRDSNEKFQQLADNITDAFWIRSPDFSEVQYVSPAFEKIWGRSVANLKANPHQWTEFIFAEDRERVLTAFAELTRDAASLEIEYRIVRPDGELRWIRVRGFQIRNAADQLIRHIGVVTDITEWRQATDALRASESEFRTLAEAMPQIVWITRPDGGTFYLNQQWSAYTGRPTEESLGQRWIESLHPEDQQPAMAAWVNATANASVFSMEMRIQRADGIYRWWLCRAVPLIDSAGRVLKWLGTGTDIHDLKLAQEQMSQQAALLDVAQDAILVKDLENRIIYWNKGAERAYGWTSQEAVGRSSTELLRENQIFHDEAQATLFANGQWHGEIVSKTKSGSEVNVDSRWTLVKDAHGQAKSILSIRTDITAKKKLEAQFLRVQRMESIGTLAGGIAHDLNNVLAPIMMSVEMLTDIAKTPEDKSLVVTLQSCTQRGANLIKQVLSFARGLDGKRVAVNVLHIIRDIENIIRDTFPKGIAFEIERPREVGTVLGDPTQLHQVFMNLCVNARDAMPVGGKLKVTFENVVLDDLYADLNPDAKAGAYTAVTVADTGSGIPLAIQSKIFEPFFTTKEIGKGTGLGLSTTITIIKSHGGFISLSSEPGKGAQFKVYLPAVVNSSVAQENTLKQTLLPHGNGELILVVDDEEAIRAVTQKTLERFNYRVLLARNGAEAIALYGQRGSEIKIVLTDMAMPIMDGPALIVALMALNSDVKIVGCSGHASHRSVAKAVDAGVQHFIPKPYTAEALLKTFRLVLQDGQGASGDDAPREGETSAIRPKHT